MFFTIVIPAFNCQDTIERLLYSIREQNTKDLKVIIVDDSDQNHPNLYKQIQPYNKYFLIDYYKRQEQPYKIHCPGNTRHSGLKKALQEDTEYIMFMDCDDKLKPKTLKTIKQILIKADYPYVMGSSFEVYNEQNQFVRIQKNNLGWLHGKCFQKNFLQKHNIQFKIDLFSHEDTYFLCLLSYYLIKYQQKNKQIAFDDYPFYIWYERDTSLSHSEINKTGICSYIANHFNDFIIASLDTFLYNIQKDNITNKQILERFYLRCYINFIMPYFYYQGFLFSNTLDFIQQNYNDIEQRLKIFLQLFNVTKEDLIRSINESSGIYTELREQAVKIFGPFVEQQSFKDFINNIKIN